VRQQQVLMEVDSRTLEPVKAPKSNAPGAVRGLLGNISRSKVRDSLGAEPDPSKVLGYFREWVLQPVILWLLVHLSFGSHSERKYVRMRGMKRGDAKYAARLRKRLERFLDYDGEARAKMSRMLRRGNGLFCTLTYRRRSLFPGQPVRKRGESWLNVSADLNRFKARLSKKWGRIATFRCFESHEDGYVHIHIMIIFREHTFRVRAHRDIDGETRLRVFGKRRLFEPLWEWGWIDVEVVRSPREAARYIPKELLKQCGSNPSVKQEMGLAMGWYYGLRLFAVSKEFDDLITDIRLTQTVLPDQLTLDGQIYHAEYRFLGSLPGWIDRDPPGDPILSDNLPPLVAAILEIKADRKRGTIADYEYNQGIREALCDGEVDTVELNL